MRELLELHQPELLVPKKVEQKLLKVRKNLDII